MIHNVTGKGKKEAAEYIISEAGGIMPETGTEKKTKRNPVMPMPSERIKSEITKLCKTAYYQKTHGKPVSSWKWTNEQGESVFVTVRFEKENGNGEIKKNIVPISFFDDDRFHAGLPMKKALPLFQLHEIVAQPGKKILVVEGEKCACVPVHGYVVTTWVGGSSRVGATDWTPLRDREIIIWPDNDEPGIHAAREIKKIIGGTILCPPENKPPGWDIADLVAEGGDPEEFLQTADYLADTERAPEPTPENNNGLPFSPLGIIDGRTAFFIGRYDHLVKLSIQNLDRVKLESLASLPWWTAKYGYDGKLAGDGLARAIDFVIDESMRRDFSPDILLGRGAWRNEETGEIAYHDGVDTLGPRDPEKIYVRKARNKIGLDVQGEPPVAEMLETANLLSFKSRADAIRTLMWATLAPFAGALEWRIAIILTGSSESGKSTIADYVVRPVANPRRFNTGTTEAAIRQCVNNDACGIVVEELENNSDKAEKRRDDIFALMRGSTTNDAPSTFKGQANQNGAIEYKMRSMFFFVSIAPEIKNVQDKNRLMFVETKRIEKDGMSWAEIRKKIVAVFSRENCKMLRSKTWKLLPEIIMLSRDIATHVCDRTNQSHRHGIQIGYVLATLMLVYLDIKNPTPDQIKAIIDEYESASPPEEDEHDDAETVIDKILTTKIRIEVAPHETKTKTIWEAARIVAMLEKPTEDLFSAPQPYRAELNRYGISVLDTYLCIANNHPQAMQTFGLIKGYGKRISRHVKYKESKPVSMLGQTRYSFIFDVLTENCPFD